MGYTRDGNYCLPMAHGTYVISAEFYPRGDVSKGTYAQYVAVEESHLAALAGSIPLDTAGGLPLVGLTAWQVGGDVMHCAVIEHCKDSGNSWMPQCLRSLRPC
jgi:NADPH:quinone reductase-like Zn-dependent oxidoreductase